jgi:hypothetical protein
VQGRDRSHRLTPGASRWFSRHRRWVVGGRPLPAHAGSFFDKARKWLFLVGQAGRSLAPSRATAPPRRPRSRSDLPHLRRRSPPGVHRCFSLPNTRVQIWSVHEEGNRLWHGTQFPGTDSAAVVSHAVLLLGLEGTLAPNPRRTRSRSVSRPSTWYNGLPWYAVETANE